MTNSAPNFDTLLGLLKHYSPSGQELPAVTWLLSRMSDLGYSDVHRDEIGNAVGIMGSGQKQIVLLGHIDTVPGEIEIRKEGDKLYGRGAVDAKGPLACFVDAVAAVGVRSDHQFVVIGAVEEERNSDGARYVIDQYQPDTLIVGEPSGWDKITLGYKGVSVVEITAQRENSHTAGPNKNACETVISVWNLIRDFAGEFNQDKGIFDQILPSLRRMASNEDGFTTWAQVTVACRLPENILPDDWVTQVSKMAEPMGVNIQKTGYPVPAYKVDKNTALVRAFLRNIRKHHGKPGFSVKTGTADLNIVGPAWNCPAVVYGPGDASLDHTPLEHISVSEYHRAIEVLRDVLIQVSDS